MCFRVSIPKPTRLVSTLPGLSRMSRRCRCTAPMKFFKAWSSRASTGNRSGGGRQPWPDVTPVTSAENSRPSFWTPPGSRRDFGERRQHPKWFVSLGSAAKQHVATRSLAHCPVGAVSEWAGCTRFKLENGSRECREAFLKTHPGQERSRLEKATLYTACQDSQRRGRGRRGSDSAKASITEDEWPS